MYNNNWHLLCPKLPLTQSPLPSSTPVPEEHLPLGPVLPIWPTAPTMPGIPRGPGCPMGPCLPGYPGGPGGPGRPTIPAAPRASRLALTATSASCSEGKRRKGLMSLEKAGPLAPMLIDRRSRLSFPFPRPCVIESVQGSSVSRRQYPELKCPPGTPDPQAKTHGEAEG